MHTVAPEAPGCSSGAPGCMVVYIILLFFCPVARNLSHLSALRAFKIVFFKRLLRFRKDHFIKRRLGPNTTSQFVCLTISKGTVLYHCFISISISYCLCFPSNIVTSTLSLSHCHHQSVYRSQTPVPGYCYCLHCCQRHRRRQRQGHRHRHRQCPDRLHLSPSVFAVLATVRYL